MTLSKKNEIAVILSPDNKINAVIEIKTEKKDWYIPISNPTWGDMLVALSLLFGFASWLFNSYKNRIQKQEKIDNEKEELKWRKAMFFFEQGRVFDSDSDISEAVRIISENSYDKTIEDIFGSGNVMGEREKRRTHHKLDKLFGLLERFSYAYQQNLMALNELSYFEWYFDEISKNEYLKEYCLKHYPTILNISDKLHEHRNRTESENP